MIHRHQIIAHLTTLTDYLSETQEVHSREGEIEWSLAAGTAVAQVEDMIEQLSEGVPVV